MKDKKEMARKIFYIIAIMFLAIMGFIDLGKGITEEKNCQMVTTAQISDIRKSAIRGMISTTVKYQYLVDNVIYESSTHYYLWNPYGGYNKVMVHYNEADPSKSYIGDKSDDTINAERELIIVGLIIILVIVVNYISNKKKE